MATEVIRRPDEAGLVPTTGVRLASSLLGGQLAGLVMAAFLAIVFAALGKDVLYPFQLIATFLFGHDALVNRTSGVILSGFLFHQLVPCLAWSLVFFGALLFVRRRLDLNSLLMLGFLIGLVSQIVDVYLITPVAQRIMAGENLWLRNVPQLWDWISHALFGLALGFFYWAVRNLIEKRRGVEHIHPKHGVTADESGVHKL